MGSKLSIITDEISQDFEEVLQIAQGFGIKDVEVRGVWGKNIALFEDEDLQKMNALLKKYEMGISMVSGPFGKSLLPGSLFDIFHKKKNFTLNPEYNLSLFDRIVEISDILGTDIIRVFNFFKFGVRSSKQKNWDKMKKYIRKYAKKAEQKGKILMLENEHVCFADNIENTFKILKEIDSPALKLNLDPGNFYSAKDGVVPEDYRIFYENEMVGYMHIKDPVGRIPIIGSNFGVVGEGKIDYESLISQALNYDYKGYFSLETHCLKNKKDVSLKSLEYLSHLLKQG